MRYEEKVCPFLLIAQALARQADPASSGPNESPRCLGPKCAWFDDNAMECAVKVLTGFYEGR